MADSFAPSGLEFSTPSVDSASPSSSPTQSPSLFTMASPTSGGMRSAVVYASILFVAIVAVAISV
jgi:hypothetical protein